MQSNTGALVTDLYQLTMGQAYFELGMRETAVFELFVRRLPRSRRFLVAAGLAQVVEYLEQLRFSSQEIDFLAGLGTFKPTFLRHLSELRFSGSVHAVPEGTPFFADEPILRVTAPILEAQLVESRILNIMHFQTLVASKAVRCVFAAGGRRVIDFGMRRAHEADASVYAARAAYLAGLNATATVEAGRRFGIPLSGTMAHSFIEAHEHEEEAFRDFVASHPGDATLLVDTYDTRRGAQRVAALARELVARNEPQRIRAVRIDSGNLEAEARAVRAILDEHLCPDIRIVLSGSLDEHSIAALVRADTPVDAFGLGTALAVSSDAPSLDMVYKLQDYAGIPRHKRSPGKVTLPGTKQVYRERDPSGHLVRDHVGLVGEVLPGQPLLALVLSDGQRIAPLPTLEESRKYCASELSDLAPPLRELAEGGGEVGLPVAVSAGLRAVAAQFDARGT
jgi:nicotinate phosphoribosyltransferase